MQLSCTYSFFVPDFIANARNSPLRYVSLIGVSVALVTICPLPLYWRSGTSVIVVQLVGKSSVNLPPECK